MRERERKRREKLLEELKADVEPNQAVLEKDEVFISLLGLVSEEYVLLDLVPDLTKEERYELAHWASCQHVAAAQEDPPLPSIPEPACMAKVALKVGRRVIVEAHGAGVITDYDWPPGNGGALDFKRPVVKLDDAGQLVYPTKAEIIGVE